MPNARTGLREKVRWWLSRYGLAELCGATLAFLSSASAHALTGSELAAAYAAAFGDSVGFYGVIFGRELWSDQRARLARGERYGFSGFWGTACNLVLEFGPAEIADLTLVRPAAIRLGTALLGRELGVFGGKVVADVIFYSAATAAYALRRRVGRVVAAGGRTAS